MMSRVSFFTPIDFGDQAKTTCQFILESVDSYFYLWGKKACVIDITDATKRTVLLQKRPSYFATCLKVLSYGTIIFPLLLLFVKFFTRCSSTYIIDQSLQARLPADPELCDFYQKKGILRIDCQPIQIPHDLEDLGLRDETLIVDFNPNGTGIGSSPSRTVISLRQAVTETINNINALITSNKRQNPDAPIAEMRGIRFSLHSLPTPGGSNFLFYWKSGWFTQIFPALITYPITYPAIFQCKPTLGPDFLIQA